MPLYEAVKRYIDTSPERFHMPGHKGGNGFSEEFRSLLSKMDVTELPGLDNLHGASGVIAEAQELAAKAFGSDICFFLVNGSTSGIHIMIHSTLMPGDEVIVPRNCHKSLWNALILSGARPVYIQPGIDPDLGLVVQVTPEQVRDALTKHKNAKGMILVHPDYYGICSDIKAIRDILSKEGKLLLVDEAHGAHFAFHSSLPPSSGSTGADIWVQSAHKTLPALTQAAYLHVKGSGSDKDKVVVYHDIYQSTSPSYPIMASLDWARHYMEEYGSSRIENLLDMLHTARNEIKKYGIRFLDEYEAIKGFMHDPTRLVMDVSEIGISGYEAEKQLRELGIFTEMADFRRVVLICTVADDDGSYRKLAEACGKLKGKFEGNKGNYGMRQGKLSISREIPQQVMTPSEAYGSICEYVPLEEAAGRICSCLIGLYPPGIPRFCPGELLDAAGIEELLETEAMGGNIFGLHKGTLVRVVKKALNHITDL